ncbi:MAG: hypothetical protein IKK27_02400, partial [Alistipes sp.]|nr:hypothetical protein [Alistipes sp.]
STNAKLRNFAYNRSAVAHFLPFALEIVSKYNIKKEVAQTYSFGQPQYLFLKLYNKRDFKACEAL